MPRAQVFRDLILSFSMPRRHVLCRRSLLFERETSRLAEVHHPHLLNRAHNAAMQMPSHVWANGVIDQIDQAVATSDYLDPSGLDTETQPEADQEVQPVARDAVFAVERSCALLSGLAMLVANDAEEARTGDAFERLVELPFLQTRLPDPDSRRITLIDACWYYYSNSRATGKLNVHMRGDGINGLVACAGALLNDARRIAK